MKMKTLLGFEVGTGEEVFIQPSHLIVTGLTQLSGKTTTLEALIKRSGLKAIVFKTKIGEKSFSEGTEVAPYFKDRSDYEFVKSLIEAYSKEKLFLEKGTLMTLCKGSKDLISIKKRIDETMAEGKLRGIKEEIYVRLQHYLEELIPQIQYAKFSNVLTVYDGINIMNLERFTEEAQSLIIQAVADEVLKSMKDVIIVIPEAWKFLPQKYNNPCKRVVEAFIRQGATNNNFIWIDSQDMAGVDKIPLKQISTWILGYQRERNEVKHTLDQISLPKKSKPKEEEIMNLKKGHFILSSYEGVKRVYVQPLWLNDSTAKMVALGEIESDSLEKPNSLVPYSRVIPQSPQQTPTPVPVDNRQVKADLIELRNDFFDKIAEVQQAITNIHSELYVLKGSIPSAIDEADLVSKVLQKIKIPQATTPTNSFNKEEFIKDVLARIPKSAGSAVYEVAPLEKLKRGFLEEAKNKILADIEGLSPDEKKALKYLESRDVDVSSAELVAKCFLLKPGGSSSTKVSTALKSLLNIECVEKTAGGRYKARVREKVKYYLATHNATEEEITNVHNHILMELLK